MSSRFSTLVVLALFALGGRAHAEEQPRSLEQQLLAETPASLADAARKQGDPRRGAVLFHQRRLACTQCHATGDRQSPLGPDLSKPARKLDAAYIVESILEPSKAIDPKHQAAQILTDDGRLQTGLIVEVTPSEIRLADAAKVGAVVVIPKKKIETVVPSKLSLMPTGLVKGLADRGQFLDLVRYVEEIAAHGPKRARELTPDPSALDSLAEGGIDHAMQIRGLAAADRAAGQKLYTQHCVSCHGPDGNKTINPVARRFAKDTLRFGTDPYAMWKTISYGNGLMFPQSHLMSPEERYLVVHYIREEFIKPANAKQYFQVDQKYLASVNERAAADAKELEPPTPTTLAAGMIDGKQGAKMDYGPCLCHSVAFSKPSSSDAPRFADTTERALVVKLEGGSAICYDTERLSIAGIWHGEIATTANTHHTSYKGGSCLTPGGEVLYRNVDDLGWSVGRLAEAQQPPRVAFKGHYLHGSQVLLKYDVAGRGVEELPSVVSNKTKIFSRTLRIAPGDDDLLCLVARLPEGKASLEPRRATLRGKSGSIHAEAEFEFVADNRGGLWVRVPASNKVQTSTILFSGEPLSETEIASPDLDSLTRGGPRRWPQVVRTNVVPGKPVSGYAADEITLPYANPWGSWLRTTAIDFFSDGRAAVSTLSGDVFVLSSLHGGSTDVTWSRFATGLYEPLGLRIIGDVVYVRGRDRITRLHDLNGDGEADHYESFHQDGEIGPNYHAFIFDLQTDRAGRLYFAKSGRKSPHEGGVIRLSSDGQSSEVVCRDFRHPNGLGAGGPHDWITVSDNPHGKAVYNGVAIVREGGLYGHEKPRTTSMLAVLPPTADSSSGGQCWSDSDRWGPLSGQMIHTSYSRCSMFYILTQFDMAHPNGFAVRMPYNFRSGVMRARVNPKDGQVYVVGQKGWDTTARSDGCLYRIRYTGASACLITSAKANRQGVRLGFSADLDPQSVTATNIEVVREEEKGVKPFKFSGVRLIDPRTIELSLPDIGEEVVARRSHTDKKTGVTTIDIAWPIRITTDLRTTDGSMVQQVVYATINSLPEAP